MKNELFGISEQLDCSDCVTHGGDWDCDHVHCRKGTDTICRQLAIWAVRKSKDKSEAHRMLIQLPNADAVPVVRCKDCTHWSGRKYNVHINGFLPWCRFSALQREANDYCNHGSRKDGDGNE